MSTRSRSRTPRARVTLATVFLAALACAQADAAAPSFAEHPIDSAMRTVRRVLAVDLDDDGDQDVLTAASSGGHVSWYRNEGAGSFTPHPVSALAGGYSGLAVGDLDRDGDLDVAAADSNRAELLWFQNNGSEVFTERTLADLVAPGGWNDVTIGDLDHNGRLDLVAIATADDAIVWFANLGGGSFAGDVLSSTAVLPQSVAVGDVNGDGDLDVLVALFAADTIAWYENHFPFAFEAHSVSGAVDGAACVAVADLDRNGTLDVLSAALLADTISWHQGGGGGTFLDRPISTTASGARSVASADLDGDGDLDLVGAAEGEDTIVWFENDGDESFTEHPLSAGGADGVRHVSVADVDSDGDLDVLAGLFDAQAAVWFENLSPPGSAFLPEARTVDAAAGGPSGIDAGDIDRDGDVDLVAAAVDDDAVSWYERDASGAFQEHLVASGGSQHLDGVNSVELADFDGDGDLDLLTAAAVGGDVAWHQSSGGGNLWFPVLIDGTAAGVRHATAGDLDRDGDLEVVAAVGGENAIFWYANDGTGSFSAGVAVPGTYLAVRSVDLGDLDGDGDLDIAFAESGGTQVGWLESNGAPVPTFTRRAIWGSLAAPFWVRVADFDGDGREDLLATSFANDQVVWLRNMGGLPPEFVRASATSGVLGATDLETVDLDRDGDLDFVVTARDADRLVWFENPGPNRGPIPQTLAPRLDGALSLVAADLDGNGTVDLAVANEAGDSVSWLPGVRALFFADFESGDDAVWSATTP